MVFDYAIRCTQILIEQRLKHDKRERPVKKKAKEGREKEREFPHVIF